MTIIDGLWAVVPAGGAGTRLWPVSRVGRPKFLHDLTGQGRTLIQQTVDRLAPLVDDRILVVTGKSHLEAVRGQVPDLPDERLLSEPVPRNSMAAIGYAAAIVERENPDALIGSFAADHIIGNTAAFSSAVSEAAAVARDHDRIVTIGIEPTHPATGFGYIQAGPRLEQYPTCARVRQFVEKPDIDRAQNYLATGEFRWNAGMFVSRSGYLMELLERWHPRLATDLREVAKDVNRKQEIWPTLESISIDHAIAEPAADEGLVLMVRADFDWDDVGDFSSLAGLLSRNKDGLSTVGGTDRIAAVNSSGLIINETNQSVAVVGMEDIIVVVTDDALLVTRTGCAQDVRKVVGIYKEAGKSSLI